MNRLLSAFALWGVVGGSYAADIQLSWDEATQREDGSEITKLDRYNIYHSVNNVVQDIIEVEADTTDFLLVDVAQGSHTFQISVVENGVESDKSDPKSLNIDGVRPASIEITVIKVFK